MTQRPVAVISSRGARRWQDGHPWIFKSDVVTPPAAAAGAVTVRDVQARTLGTALWSPQSEISLRFVARDEVTLDGAWWGARIGAAIARRQGILDGETNACRLVHGEGDGLPSLVVDRFDRWLVVQLLSAGLEAYRAEIVDALVTLTDAAGVLARNDASVRTREGLAKTVEPLSGSVPETIEVREHGVRYLAAPHTGQKTGAFLDQREARVLIGSVARGRALDVFSYHGSFALHLARRAEHVRAVDASAAALARVEANAALNGLPNIEAVEADAFDFLREEERGGARYDTIVLDPPAFAKNRASLAGAIRGYRDINLRAMKLLAPGGMLYTASCSYHLTKPDFLAMLREAAAHSGRRMILRAITGQPVDHPELLTVPETGYLKGALLEAGD
ncbi:class I SAM-dependent rRNA methyltransferase [Pseudogemmatithrix spongiicola]|uniref:Class I SAM-dependent rRNA methyltransferase n=1 Tax=Pseudogemmatithrix spongiicola TaxID=3062599 RepID=A0AA49JSJ4_9BACT|nr:class I SAM-dependent rRNA methyltransferase [Gemmatimonadaceae bacterium 'strain 138']WKW14140.1 class I SAM-dependent rRNA methyltransferase [Gemmatimonadaceae bacterium 'strain 318']